MPQIRIPLADEETTPPPQRARLAQLGRIDLPHTAPTPGAGVRIPLDADQMQTAARPKEPTLLDMVSEFPGVPGIPGTLWKSLKAAPSAVMTPLVSPETLGRALVQRDKTKPAQWEEPGPVARSLSETVSGMTSPAMLAGAAVLPALPALARGAIGAGFGIHQLYQAGKLQEAISKANMEADAADARGDADAAKQLRDTATYLRTHQVTAGTVGALAGLGAGMEASRFIDRAVPPPKLPTQRLLTEGTRELTAAPPLRGGRVTADFVREAPITEQPEKIGLPSAVERLLPPAPIRGGRFNAEFVDVPPRVGYPPQRIPLPTNIAGELPGLPERRQLNPSPELELPGGGTLPRGTLPGLPGGIPERPEATIVPTRQGVTPRTKESLLGQVDRLQSELAAAQERDKDYGRQVNTGFDKLKGRKPSPTLRELVQSQQGNRQRIKSLQAELEAANPKPSRPTLSSEIANASPDILATLSQDIASSKTPRQDMAARVQPASDLLGQVEALRFTEGKTRPTLGQNEAEAATLLGRGRRPELLKEGKQFDETRLVGSELFQGRGGPQRSLMEEIETQPQRKTLSEEIGYPAPAVEAKRPPTPYESALDDATHANMQAIAETFQTMGASDPVTGSGRTRSITGMPRQIPNPQTGEILGTAGTIGGGGKDVFGLGEISESPIQIARAIEKGSGALFERVKRVVREATEREHGEAIARYAEEAPGADTSFNFGRETGAFRLGVLRPIHHIRQAIFNKAETAGEAALQRIGSVVGKAFDQMPSETGQRIVETIKRNLGLGEYERPEAYKVFRRERRGDIAEARDYAENVRDQMLASLPDEQSRTLAFKIATNKATPEDFTAAAKNPNIQGMAEMVRKEFMKTAESFVTEGVRQYSKLDQTAREALNSFMKGETKAEDLGPGLRQFANSGVAKYFGEYVPRLYTSNDAAKVFKKYGVSEARVRLELSRLKTRGNLSPEVRAALGEITELIEPATKGIFEENVLLANNRFFQKIANDPKLTRVDPALAPESWQTLPEVDTLGPLSGKTVHPSVYRDLTEMIKAPDEAWRIVRTLNRWVKKGKTVYNPATHVRNYQSNWITRDAIGGMDISSQAVNDLKAAHDFLKKSDRYTEARKNGLFDTDYTAFDLSGVRMETAPEVKPAGISGAFDVTGAIFQAFSKADKAATFLYRLEDDLPKLGMYNWLRAEKNLSPTEAVKQVLETLQDYSEVPPIVEKLQRSPIGPTFLTYQAQMVPRFMRAIVKHPFRAGKYVVVGTLVGKALIDLGLKSEDEARQEEKEMPEYMKPTLGGAVSPFVPLPLKDKHGRSLYFDTTYALPYGNMMDQSGFFGLPSVFDVGILPGTFWDLATNVNSYASYLRGSPSPIWRETDTSTEKLGKGALYAGQQLLPTLTPGVGFGARRLRSALKETPSYYGDAPQSRTAAFLQVLGGQKTVAIDARAEAERRQREVRADLAEIEGQVRSVRRNQSLSAVEKMKEIQRLERDRQRRMEQYQNR